MHLHSLLTYSHANRAVLKLRDQKQLDFEELSDYLSGVTAERDRLSAVIKGQAGSTGLGLGAYLRERVDAIRGADDDRSRVEKMKKLDDKIKEVRRESPHPSSHVDAKPAFLVTRRGHDRPRNFRCIQRRDSPRTSHISTCQRS